MKNLLIAIILIISNQVLAVTEIAVIDTGLSPQRIPAKICKNGLLDFTTDQDFRDIEPFHGTNVIGLITKHAGNADYCIISLKVFKNTEAGPKFNTAAYIAALKYLTGRNPALLNISSAGINSVSRLESIYLKKLLDSGTVVIVAAGNARLNLDKIGCVVYPACADSRIFVVGNVKGSASNTGKFVDIIVNGEKQTAGGVTLYGSSQSAAIFSGTVINKTFLKLRQSKPQILKTGKSQ